MVEIKNRLREYVMEHTPIAYDIELLYESMCRDIPEAVPHPRFDEYCSFGLIEIGDDGWAKPQIYKAVQMESAPDHWTLDEKRSWNGRGARYNYAAYRRSKLFRTAKYRNAAPEWRSVLILIEEARGILNHTTSLRTIMKLGYADRRVEAPTNPQELCKLLSTMMAAAINHEVEVEDAKLALNAATRIVEVMQADTRMKAVAHSMKGVVTETRGWAGIEQQPAFIENGAETPNG